MKKMPDIYLKDLLRPEWMLRKICRWLDGDIKGNVRLALEKNDLGKGLWEYRDQQDHAQTRILEIEAMRGVRLGSELGREKIWLQKFVDSLSVTMDAIRQAYRGHEPTRKVPPS